MKRRDRPKWDVEAPPVVVGAKVRRRLVNARGIGFLGFFSECGSPKKGQVRSGWQGVAGSRCPAEAEGVAGRAV